MAQEWTGRVFATDLEAFRQHFKVRSFPLQHRLAGHPLFTLERLALAAERAMTAGQAARFQASGNQGRLGSRFEIMGKRESCPELIVNLAQAKAWSKLSAIDDYDADYADLLSDALADLREMTGDPRLQVSHAHFTVFMTSPDVVTPFHMDHEANILSQISGNKKVFCAFPPDDRELVPLSVIERFYVKDINSAQYDPRLQSRGTETRLLPGTAVCVAPLAPHWVQNGNETSISLSLSLCFPHLERRARIHQVNYHLRRVGLTPAEPAAGWLDNAKAWFLATLAKRNPRTYHDLVFSGVERLRSPGRWLNRLRHAFKPRI